MSMKFPDAGVPASMSVAQLRDMLDEPPPRCWVAFQRLAELDDRAALDVLKEETIHRDPYRRRAAAQALGRSPLGQNAAVELRRLIDDPSPYVVRSAIEAADALLGIFAELRYGLIEGPFARTWDDESRAFFEENGIQTEKSATMYTSVHYIVGSASRTLVTCEIQVRTLMEEVWGEVDHAMNYPTPTSSLACREQLKVLARATSTATRLVDSIFRTRDSESARSPDADQDKTP